MPGPTLPTVTAGDPVSSAELMTYIGDVEYYTNETIGTGDIQTSAPWVSARHVYKPEFWTGIAPFTRLVSGEVHYRYRPFANNRRSVHHCELTTGATAGVAGLYYPIEGMSVSFSTPTAISSGSLPEHRVRVRASWYAYEMGGTGGTVDEKTDRCADMALVVNGTTITATSRPLFTASDGVAGFAAAQAWHQYSVAYPVECRSAGENHIGVNIRLYSRGDISGGAAHNKWRHIVIGGRSLSLSWFRL